MTHASAAEAHGHHEHDIHPDEFGVASTGKIAMWIFLLSDALSFGGLLLGYAILRAHQPSWPDPKHYLGINFTAGMTFLLICSSVTMVMALAAAHDRNRKQTIFYLFLTALGGVLFLGGQVYEYTHLYHDQGMTLSGTALALKDGIPPAFSSTFFVITSFHGMHVTTGVIYLLVMLFKVSRGKYMDDATPIEICGLFWHFVDLIWILVFTFVYLIP
jgi:heme/copper-type cytochrome/quinol oxidase subunit 3